MRLLIVVACSLLCLVFGFVAGCLYVGVNAQKYESDHSRKTS